MVAVEAVVCGIVLTRPSFGCGHIGASKRGRRPARALTLDTCGHPYPGLSLAARHSNPPWCSRFVFAPGVSEVFFERAFFHRHDDADSQQHNQPYTNDHKAPVIHRPMEPAQQQGKFLIADPNPQATQRIAFGVAQLQGPQICLASQRVIGIACCRRAYRGPLFLVMD